MEAEKNALHIVIIIIIIVIIIILLFWFLLRNQLGAIYIFIEFDFCVDGFRGRSWRSFRHNEGKSHWDEDVALLSGLCSLL